MTDPAPMADSDPEDAYDAADPEAERLAVLGRAVTSIEAEATGLHGHDRVAVRIAEALRELALIKSRAADDLRARLEAVTP